MERSSLQWNAELYQGSSSLQSELGMMALEKLQPVDRERIMDLGCGNGFLSIELARRIPHGHVTGIEASPEMFALANRNAAESGIRNIRLLNINALDIDFYEEFDALFSNSAIHWINDLETMYGLIFSALKPGGRIMVQTSLREMNTLYETIFAILQVERYRPYFKSVSWPWKFLTREENTALLIRTGFAGIDIERYEHRYVFRSTGELSGYLESAPMVPFISHLPEEEQGDFKKLFVQTYLDRNNSRAEAVTARAFISARKP